MENSRIIDLYQRYRSGQASLDELKELQLLMDDEQAGQLLHEFWKADWKAISIEEINELRLANDEQIFESIVAEPQIRLKTMTLWPRIAIAAAVAVMILGAGLFYYNLNNNHQQPDQVALKNDVAPGKSGATLTLASGKRIRLTEAASGELASESGVSITKSADGQLVYEVKSKNTDPDKINTLATARGETYTLRLPDGSLVWLNAASSLTYATALNERGVRRVKLEGEGYFEIAKDKAHPFVVESMGQQVEVLGTHFNVSAYGEESATKTSLLEGSVRLNDSKVLRPGEQATLSRSGKISIAAVDVGDAVAWKNGKFVFDYENLESVMRKLARWYDVEIVYQTETSKKTFSGTVSRFDKISKTLEKITYTSNVHFKIEGRRIMVID